MKKIIVLISFMSFMAAHASVAEVYVISSPDLNISASEIKDVYSGDKQLAGATKLAPIDNKAAQGEFLEKVMKMDPVKYSTSWAKKTFREGIAAPRLKVTDAEVIDFVKNTPGAVGYVKTSPPASVKTVQKY